MERLELGQAFVTKNGDYVRVDEIRQDVYGYYHINERYFVEPGDYLRIVENA